MKIVCRFLTKIIPSQNAYCHCDIPCGIYDPHLAQVSAYTVIRMTDLILDLKKENTATGDKEFMHKIARYTKVKEEHAEMVKHEVRIIWGDYFKEEHLKNFPDLHGLVFKIMKLASKSRQGVDKQSANELLSSVQEFSRIFWKTKSRETDKVASSYPTGGEIVLPK